MSHRRIHQKCLLCILWVDWLINSDAIFFIIFKLHHCIWYTFQWIEFYYCSRRWILNIAFTKTSSICHFKWQLVFVQCFQLCMYNLFTQRLIKNYEPCLPIIFMMPIRKKPTGLWHIFRWTFLQFISNRNLFEFIWRSDIPPLNWKLVLESRNRNSHSFSVATD